MTDKYGKTPLELAWDKGFAEIAHLLAPPAPEEGELPSTPPHGGVCKR
jgi:hypothetical protein